MIEKNEFNFTRKDFDYLREIVFKETGIVSDEGKFTMYYSRLARRLRKLELKSFDEYRTYFNKNKSEELIEIVNAVTTNLTSFFRENHHFEFLKDVLIPEKKKADENRLRIWSAACSTGEEPYSIAMSVIEALPNYRDWDIEILATDIDSNVVQTAQRGVYTLERIESLDKKRVSKFMKKGSGKNAGYIKLNDEVKELIQFKQLNLLKSWNIKEQFDVIFCRNVVIYFDNETKISLVKRFYDQIKPQGYLLMGHSESLHNISEDYQLLGKTIYQKP